MKHVYDVLEDGTELKIEAFLFKSEVWIEAKGLCEILRSYGISLTEATMEELLDASDRTLDEAGDEATEDNTTSICLSGVFSIINKAGLHYRDSLTLKMWISKEVIPFMY